MAIDPYAILPVVEKFALLEFFIPTLIFTAIFYSVLSKLKLFSENKINAIISICLAAIITLAHMMGTIPRCWDAVGIMLEAVPKLGIFMFGLLIFIVILGIVGVAADFLENWKMSFLVGTFLYFTYAFLSSRGPSCPFFLDLTNDSILVILIFAIMLAMGYAVYSSMD